MFKVQRYVMSLIKWESCLGSHYGEGMGNHSYNVTYYYKGTRK